MHRDIRPCMLRTISSEHECHGIEPKVSSVVVPDHSSKHTCYDTGAFQSEVSSCMNTQCSTSILKDETSHDITSVKTLFNLLDSYYLLVD
jgi:hypothetical protein